MLFESLIYRKHCEKQRECCIFSIFHIFSQKLQLSSPVHYLLSYTSSAVVHRSRCQGSRRPDWILIHLSLLTEKLSLSYSPEFSKLESHTQIFISLAKWLFPIGIVNVIFRIFNQTKNVLRKG